MTKEAVETIINGILDEWDPIGTNHFAGGPMNEYRRYVPRVVKAYVAGTSMLATLDALQVEIIDNSSDEMAVATRRASDDLDTFLNDLGRTELSQLYSL